MAPPLRLPLPSWLAQGRFSDLLPLDRTKRKRVLQTIFDRLRAETFRERRTILKRIYRVECIKEETTGRIVAVGRAIYDGNDWAHPRPRDR
jgi:hypothetical protein